MKIMVSACLLGVNCKYNGTNNLTDKIVALKENNEVIAVCPELLGGLSRPKPPSEIYNGKVIDKFGNDEDEDFRKGAQKTLELAQKHQPDLIILQSRSPSCGVNHIYDGTFSGKLIKGMGITARLLHDNGFNVVDVEDF